MVTTQVRKSHSANEAARQAEPWILVLALQGICPWEAASCLFLSPTDEELPLASLIWEALHTVELFTFVSPQSHITNSARVISQLPISLAVDGARRKEDGRMGRGAWT